MLKSSIRDDDDEEDWLTTTDVWQMWRSLPTVTRFSNVDRKRLLLAVAVVRGIEHLMTDPRSRAVIPIAERYADGLATSDEMQAAHDEARDAADRNYPSGSAGNAAFAARKLWHDWTDLGEAAEAVVGIGGKDEETRILHLIREVYGNPFRHVFFDPAWRTDTTTSIAKGMYDSRDFSAMPILADALQDAGCDNEAILTHCRDEKAIHVRGCWVVDLVLDKS